MYQATYDEFAQYTNPTLNYAQTSVIGRYIQDHVGSLLASDAETWKVTDIYGDPYFIYTLKTGETYIGAWVSVQEIISQIRKLEMGKLLSVSFKNGNFVKAYESFYENNADDGGTQENGLFLEAASTYNVTVYLDAADMNIIATLETVPFYQYLSLVQKVIIAASIIIVILVICSVFCTGGIFFHPCAMWKRPSVR